MSKKKIQIEILVLTVPTSLARVLTPPKTRNCPFGCGTNCSKPYWNSTNGQCPYGNNTFQKGTSLTVVKDFENSISAVTYNHFESALRRWKRFDCTSLSVNVPTVYSTPRPGWMDVPGGGRAITKRLENAKNVLSNAVFGEGKEMSGSNPENRIWVAGKF